MTTIGRTVSHYNIVAEIGSGSMDVVYEAEDTRLHRLAALELIHPPVPIQYSAVRADEP